LEALERLAALRGRGNPRALAVMASGLGKTYVAALDAAQFERENASPIRVLYLSHQHIILEQARETFRRVFGKARSYGMFVGGKHELDADFVFGTFQSVGPALDQVRKGAFNYVVVDEAHHSAAATREEVIRRLNPAFLLGLTATDFRADGKDIHAYYDDVVAVSIPLERALIAGLLTPIDYRVFCDTIDPDDLGEALQQPVRSGRNLFEAVPDDKVVHRIYKAMERAPIDPRVIVFCASVRQMDHFHKLMPGSRTVSGRDERAEQLATVEDFREGKFKVLLSRDVLNEGIDVPHATTIVFLRNTESPVVFLQQLGRGLRRIEGKAQVEVLDFVNNLDRIEFVYSLFSRIRTTLAREDADGFPSIEAGGISLELDETSRDVVKALIAKKASSGLLADFHGLSGALDFEVNPQTLRHIVDRGRLIPDFVLPNGGKHVPMYFKKGTVERFMRQVVSPRFAEGFLSLKEFAQVIDVKPRVVRDRQRLGALPASWVYRPKPGKVDLYFTPDDAAAFKSNRRRESLRAEARQLAGDQEDLREKAAIAELMSELAPAEPPL
jgi:superfamily II DNA or RNA helicase